MEFDKGLVGGSTPLMLLSLLHEADMYGYQIIRELEVRSNQAFLFKEGTLYPVLHRMENQGLIKSYRKQAENGKERKYYCITKLGLSQLELEKAKWASFTESVGRVVGGNVYGLCEA